MRHHSGLRTWWRLPLLFFVALFLLSGCPGGGGDDNGTQADNQTVSTSIPDTTVVLNDATLAQLKSVSPDTSQLTFTTSTSQLDSLNSGDVIVVGLTDQTPMGLLRKVTSVSTNASSEVVVVTGDATLTDAIENGELSLVAGSDDLVVDEVVLEQGVEQASAPIQKLSAATASSRIDLTINKQIAPGVTLNGGVAITPAVEFDFTIRWFKLRKVSAKASLSETANLDVTAATALTLEQRKKIGEVKFKPITGYVGPVPIYIRPVLQLFVGADGTLEASLTTGVNQELSYSIGLKYEDGAVSPISERTSSFSYTKPSLEGSATLHPYVEAGMIFYLYGVVGPSGSAEGYLELSADINKDPWWQLHAGLAAKFGIKGKIFSYTLADYEKTVLEYRILLAEGQKPALAVSPAVVAPAEGIEGGPFTPGNFSYNLDVVGDSSVNWSVSESVDWADLCSATASGAVSPGTPVTVTFCTNAAADGKSAGYYKGSLTFSNDTNGEGSTSRPIALQVNQPPSIRVEPGPDQIYFIGGDEGSSSFAPGSKSYTVYAEGGAIDWSVSSDVSWLTVSPSSGSLADGLSDTVTVTVDQGQAALLPADRFPGLLTFTNSTNGSGNTTRSAWLTASMKVAPVTPVTMKGGEGGPFTPAQSSVTITAVNGDLPWRAGSTVDWLTLSAEQGSLSAGGSSDVTIQPGTQAEALTPNSYSGQVVFTNGNNPDDTTTVPVSLEVLQAIEVAPTSGISASGGTGGPFTPSSVDYTISAPGGDINWSASTTATWLSVSPGSGTAGPGSPATVTVSVNSTASGLPEGSYSGAINFTKTNGKTKAVSRSAALNINNSLPATIDGNWEVTCSASDSYDQPIETLMGQTFPTSATITVTGGTGGYTLDGLPPGSASGTAALDSASDASLLSDDLIGSAGSFSMSGSIFWYFDVNYTGQRYMSFVWYVDHPDAQYSGDWTCEGTKVQ